MSKHRFYSPQKLAAGATIELSENAARHAMKVLRLRIDDVITLFNGDGANYEASILRSTKEEGTIVKVISQQATDREPPLKVTLAQAISSGDRMDITLQKAVELGVNCIQPLAAERSVVKLTGDKIEKRREHWQNVVISACEQSGRSTIPQVLPPIPYFEWLGRPLVFDLKLILSPTAENNLHSLTKPDGEICLLIGCEGGFSPQELITAEQQGFTSIRLGKRVLRTETAALAALSAIQTVWGDF